MPAAAGMKRRLRRLVLLLGMLLPCAPSLPASASGAAASPPPGASGAAAVPGAAPASPSDQAAAPGELPLTVDTGGLPAVPGYPVSFAVQFPPGAVPDRGRLALVDSAGRGAAAQFSSLARWEDGSEKSVLLSFYPEPEGTRYRGYQVLYGSRSGSSVSVPDAIRISETARLVQVDTGFARFLLSKERFVLFEQIQLRSQPTALLKSPAALVFKEGTSGAFFSSSLFTRRDGYRLTVLEQGPLRALLLLEGKVRAATGGPGWAGGRDLVSVKVWLTFHAGSGIVTLKHTMIDSASGKGSWQRLPGRVLEISGNHLELPLNLGPLSYTFGGEGGQLHQGAVEGEHFLYQDASATFNAKGRYDYLFLYQGAGSGAKAPGWLDLAGAKGGVTAALRYFWQNYPNKLAIDRNGLLTVSLQPEESPNLFYTLYPGVAKTHDIFLNFHQGGALRDRQGLAELFLKGPVLKAPARWHAATGVFGPISASSARSAGWEAKVARQYDCSGLRRNCALYPEIFGKRDFGDYQMGIATARDGTKSPILAQSHYEDAHGWILEFLRQGERSFFDYAAPFAVHHYDLDVMHLPNPGPYPGMPAGMIHWHGSSDHETSAKLELGHVAPGGIAEYYLLTGDPRSLEVIREQGDWVSFWARSGKGRVAPERAGDAVGLEEYERPHAWPLYTLLKCYEASGDPGYWNAATIVMDNLIKWWQMPQTIVVFEPGKTLDPRSPVQQQALYYEETDWLKGNGYFLSTMMTANTARTSEPLKNHAYQNHVPIAWMAAYLETAIIRYYEHLKRMGGSYSATIPYRGRPSHFCVDAATVREMIIQTVEVLVSHNWVSKKYPSQFPWLKDLELEHWVYSVTPERDPKSTDGNLQMPFVLLYAASFSREEVSPRWQPVWERLRAKWVDIAKTSHRKYVETGPARPETGYNGATVLWNHPYALKYLGELP